MIKTMNFRKMQNRNSNQLKEIKKLKCKPYLVLKGKEEMVKSIMHCLIKPVASKSLSRRLRRLKTKIRTTLLIQRTRIHNHKRARKTKTVETRSCLARDCGSNLPRMTHSNSLCPKQELRKILWACVQTRVRVLAQQPRTSKWIASKKGQPQHSNSTNTLHWMKTMCHYLLQETKWKSRN